MNITDLVKFFRNGGSFEEFCKIHSLDPKSEVIEIFGSSPLLIESPLAFFEIEKTEGQNRHLHDGIEYRSLFDFYFFEDARKESKEGLNRKLSYSVIAEKLLSYALNDA